MVSSLAVTIGPSWLGTWFVRVLARPVIVVDGTGYQAFWGVPGRWTTLPEHTLRAHIHGGQNPGPC